MTVDLELVTVVDDDNPVLGDLRLVAGDFVLVRGVDAIAQHVRVRLRFFLGEWFLDEREGVPFFSDVLVKNPNLALITTEFRRVIADTPGVVSVDELRVELDAARRRLSVSGRATADDGAAFTLEEFIVAEAA